MKAREDTIILLNEFNNRILIAHQIYNQCCDLDLQTKHFLSQIQQILETVAKEKINSDIFALWQKYPNLLPVRNDFFDKDLISNMNALKESLFAIPPENANINSLFPQVIPQCPSLKDFDYEKLGFLTSKHRSIIALYEECLRHNNTTENLHNKLSIMREGKRDRKFIYNITINYINFDTAINKLLPILNELIKENNLVREDFRLQLIPESTFRRASFWKIPILWFFRWFK